MQTCKLAAWDTETWLIGPARQAPPLVCTSIKTECGEFLLHHTESKPFFDQIFFDKEWHFAGHNLVYDLGVVVEKWPEYLPVVFDVIEQGRAHCTMLRMQLIDIATGCFRGEYRELTENEKKRGKKGVIWQDIRYDLSSTHARFTKKFLDKDT